MKISLTVTLSFRPERTWQNYGKSSMGVLTTRQQRKYDVLRAQERVVIPSTVRQYFENDGTSISHLNYDMIRLLSEIWYFSIICQDVSKLYVFSDWKFYL